MKKYLLPQDGQPYKANLHCHTTVSDGVKTPEQVKELYKSMGYSIVAYTDHNIFVPHPELCDESFVALSGFETDTNNHIGNDFALMKTCHVCYIALSADNDVQPVFNKDNVWGNATDYIDKIKTDDSAGFVRQYNSDNINKMMQIAKDAGFFVTYNHPTWSKETYNEYMSYSGMHAFEIFNGSSYALGYEEYNPKVYDDLLTNGKLCCIGADDNHNYLSGTPYTEGDSGIAFTVIKAPSLTYNDVTTALVNGNFYASMGPKIDALWFENGVVHIECSEACRVTYNTGIRHAAVAYANDKPITSADFEVYEKDKYFRITVIDEKGRCACTNAYFTNELFEN